MAGVHPGRRLRPRLAAARGALAVTVAASVLATVLTLGQWVLLAAVLAPVAQGRLTSVPGAAWAGLVALVTGRAALDLAAAGSGRRAATTVMSQLRLDLVHHRLVPHPRPALLSAGRDQGGDLGGGGRLATQAVSGVDGLGVYVAEYLPQRVLAVVAPVLVLALVAVLDLPSALILVATLPVVPVFMVVVGRSAAARSRANLAALDALAAHFLDVVRGLGTLRAFNQAATQADEVGAVTDRYRQTTADTLRLAFLSGAVLELAATLATALVAVGLGVRLVAGSVELLPAMVVLFVVPELFAPLRRVGSLFHASSDGLAAASGILDAIDPSAVADADTADATADAAADSAAAVGPARPVGVRPARTSSAGTSSAGTSAAGTSAAGTSSAGTSPPGTSPGIVPAAASVRLSSVVVRHPGRSRPALAGVDLEISPGELVVVLGASGSGKTTLGRVLVGLTRPDVGAVLVGDRLLTDADLDGWRHLVAWAPQRPSLLAMTVAENLALGLGAVDRAVVVDAARRAGAHEFVARLPDGYDTVVGPGSGLGLSAGQRQRLGLARALLRDAPLTVLDEPTAYLDASAARQVAAAVETTRARRSVVLITHDPDLVRDPDQVVRLAAGRRTVTDPAIASAAVLSERFR